MSESEEHPPGWPKGYTLARWYAAHPNNWWRAPDGYEWPRLALASMALDGYASRDRHRANCLCGRCP